MTSPHSSNGSNGSRSGERGEPSGETLAVLAVQLASLRGQVTLINQRLDAAGLTGDVNLAAEFEELAATVRDALDAASPSGPAPVLWLGLDTGTYAAELAKLRGWVDQVLRGELGERDIKECWPAHRRAVYELSVLAAEWHRTYGGKRPDRDRALNFHDRWLPGTIKRVAEFTRRCAQQCIMVPRNRQ